MMLTAESNDRLIFIVTLVNVEETTLLQNDLSDLSSCSSTLLAKKKKNYKVTF